MLKHIVSDSDGNPVSVNTDEGEDKALVVATRPHKIFTPKVMFFTNPTYGVEMAQDGAFGGAPLLIHDGTDTVAWTFSEPVGTKWTADSTDRPYVGTMSLKCDNPDINDIMQLINNVGPGTDIDMTGNYVAITMWINVDKDWAAGDSMTLYAHLDGALVGNAVGLEDYFPYLSVDTWHYINIPLTDLGIEASSIDSFRIECSAKDGKAPKFYIDEMYLQETGTPVDFTLKPDRGTWLHIGAIHTTFVDTYNSENADASMPSLTYDQLLGMTPGAGYILKRCINSEEVPCDQRRVTSLLDLLSFPGSKISNQFSDGTTTLITVDVDYPSQYELILKSEDLDQMVCSIEDSFDDLLFMRMSVQGYVEQRD